MEERRQTINRMRDTKNFKIISTVGDNGGNAIGQIDSGV